jgi:hypothetical protein
VSPLLNSSEAAKDAPVRHFSAFPLTSHMHTPTLRLVSLHPSLSVTLTFARVPEIHETFTWKAFFARESTVDEVMETVVEELGLAKALPVPGTGTLEYVLEEVFGESEFRLRLCPLVFVFVLIPPQTLPGSRPRLDSQRYWRQHRRNHPRTPLYIASVYQTSGIEGAGQERCLRVP